MPPCAMRRCLACVERILASCYQTRGSTKGWTTEKILHVTATAEHKIASDAVTGIVKARASQHQSQIRRIPLENTCTLPPKVGRRPDTAVAMISAAACPSSQSSSFPTTPPNHAVWSTFVSHRDTSEAMQERSGSAMA